MGTGTGDNTQHENHEPFTEKLQPKALQQLLGVHAVLLAVGHKKNPLRKKWGKVRFEETQSPSYQATLAKAPAIGVLLGSPSEGLCSVDFDCEEYLNAFLTCNHSLPPTLQTKGKRGCNLWFVVEGSIPPTKHLKRGGKNVGEWRSDDHQTIITGRHPDGLSYRIEVNAPPLRIKFTDLIWPPNDCEWPLLVFQDDSPSPLSFNSSQSSQSLNTLNTLNTLYNIGEKEKRERQAKDDLPPDVAKLYNKYVRNKFTPRQGSRNSDLLAMITFLFQVLGEERLQAVAEAFYDLNQSVFRDSREQHLEEIAAIISGRRKTWLGGLNSLEREYFSSMSPIKGQAFRICRDLVATNAESDEPWDFFLSCNDLGNRLNLHPPEAQRILSAFETMELISVAEKGTQHKNGKRGQATRWRWHLPSPEERADATCPPIASD